MAMSQIKIKTYIINLPKDRDRRESILAETGKLPCLDIEMIKAVYGKELTDEERNRLFDSVNYIRHYGRSLLPGEIGCTLSHRECYRRLLESDCELALVLEDDAQFADSAFTEDFSRYVVEFMHNEKPLMVLLHADFEYIGKKQCFYDKYDLYPVYKALYTTAYLVNKSAVRLLLQKETPFWVADDWLRFRRWGVRVYCLYPSVVIQRWDELSSSIGEEKRSLMNRKPFPNLYRIYNKLEYIFIKKLGIIKYLRG